MLEGFIIRNVNIDEDHEKVREVELAVFRHCSSLTKERLEIYSQAPFYHQDLDLVVVAPDGNFASFCIFRVDPESKITELEPVGTHPDYRKCGLAQVLISEGLNRLEHYQISKVYILGAAANEGATRLYDSLGFTLRDRVFRWQKKI